MKKLVSLIIAAAVCTSVWSAPAAHFTSPVHNFGAFSEDDGPQTARFALVNDGSEPIAILSGRATCGCTTPTYPRESIAPGDTAFVEVTFDPGGRPGRFSKYVYIETTAEPAKSRLEVKGVVIGSGATVARRYPMDLGPLKLAQRALLLGEVEKGRLKTMYFDGYNRSADSLRVAVVHKPEWLDVTVAPSPAPPGEQVSLLACVNSARCPLYGLVEDSLTIAPTPGEQYSIPLTVIVKEDFSRLSAKQLETAPVAALSERTIDLGTIERDAQPLHASFKISNAGKDALLIRRVYSADRGVSVAVDHITVKKGKHATATVTVDPSATPTDLLNARITVITNDPKRPTQTVRLTAMVK